MSDFEKALEKKINRTKGSGDPFTEEFGYEIGHWVRAWFLKNYSCASFNVECKEIKLLEVKIEKMKEAVADEVTCPDCVEAIGDGYTICGECSCEG